MKSMRDMIKLMEGVMAVPGMGQVGGSESDMQTAGTVGRNASYAEFDSAQQPATEGTEFDNERHYRDGHSFGQAVKAGQHAKLNDMEASKYSPSFMKGYQAGLQLVREEAPPGMEDVVLKLKKEYPNDHSRAFATAWSIYNKKHGKAEEGCTMEEAQVDTCRQSNPASADVACAMEESVSDLIYDQQYSRFSDLMNSFVEPQEAFDVLSREMVDQGIEGEEHDAIMQRLENDFFPDDSAFDMMNGPDDFSDDADALASAGHGSDEDYGDFPIDEDINNGYDDINNANGNDFFPNGADSPVVKAVGPSGARQGDNPEQKKMQVAEVHKELVYGYRNFLKEATLVSQKKS